MLAVATAVVGVEVVLGLVVKPELHAANASTTRITSPLLTVDHMVSILST